MQFVRPVPLQGAPIFWEPGNSSLRMRDTCPPHQRHVTPTQLKQNQPRERKRGNKTNKKKKDDDTRILYDQVKARGPWKRPRSAINPQKVRRTATRFSINIYCAFIMTQWAAMFYASRAKAHIRERRQSQGTQCPL